MVAPEIVASHQLAYAEGHIIDENTRKVFDRISYSRMKYGDVAATDAFAEGLANVLIQDVPELVSDTTPPDFLVAYKAVPPACYYLSRFCLDRVNVARLEEGNEPGRIIHVYKNRVAATNYAAATPEERQRELSSIGFSLEGRSLHQRPAVVLDDIRITGAAERTLLEVIKPEDPKRVALGYIAIFDPEQAAANPQVENDLNMSVIKGVGDLLPMIEADNFCLNIRTLKLILGSPLDELEVFLKQIPPQLQNEILRGAVDTGVDFIDKYRSGYQLLASNK